MNLRTRESENPRIQEDENLRERECKRIPRESENLREQWERTVGEDSGRGQWERTVREERGRGRCKRTVDIHLLFLGTISEFKRRIYPM